MDEKLEELIERGMKMLDAADRQEAEKRRLEEEERQKRIEDEWAAIISLLPEVLVPHLVKDDLPLGGLNYGNRLNFKMDGLEGFQAVVIRTEGVWHLNGYMVADGQYGLPYRPELLALALAHARRLFIREHGKREVSILQELAKGITQSLKNSMER